MLRFSSILVLFIIAIVAISCENPVEPEEPTGWFLQREQEGEAGYYTIYFVDENQGWIAGSGGTIKHTSNGGRTWKSQISGVSARIWDIQFMDDETGWACGAKNTILRTTDGGKTWQDVSPPDTSDRIFLSIKFVDEEIGWTANNQGELIKSIDSGVTWTFVKQISRVGFLMTAFAPNTVYAWAGKLYRSFDGGATWDTTATPYPSYGEPYGPHSMFFHDQYHGWMPLNNITGSLVTHSMVMITNNGGTNWFLSDSLEHSWLYWCYFVNESQGWLAAPGAIYQSTDGGEHWSAVCSEDTTPEVTDYPYNESDIFFLNENLGWVLSFEGNIWKFAGPEP